MPNLKNTTHPTPSTPEGVEMPEPSHREASSFGWPDLYTADQMRTYAQHVVAHDREAIVEALRLDAIAKGRGVRRAQAFAWARETIRSLALPAHPSAKEQDQ